MCAWWDICSSGADCAGSLCSVFTDLDNHCQLFVCILVVNAQHFFFNCCWCTVQATQPQSKCDIIYCLPRPCGSLHKRAWRRTICSLSEALLLNGGQFILTLLRVRAVCQVSLLCQIPRVREGWNVSKRALDSPSHSQRVSQAASLPAEGVVNGAVLPIGSHGCSAPPRTLNQAQLYHKLMDIMQLAIKSPRLKQKLLVDHLYESQSIWTIFTTDNLLYVSFSECNFQWLFRFWMWAVWRVCR